MGEAKKESKELVIRRLRKIEGQVKGIQKMIDEEKSCTDVLTQVTAIRSAINAVGALIVEKHTKECIIQAIEQADDKEEVINDLVGVLGRFTKG